MAFKQAKWYQNASRKPEDIRLEVLHTMEAPEKGTTAEAVANYFASGTVKASAHYCIDNDSVVQCVKDEDIAYAAPGANHDGRQYEQAGYARQSVDEWKDLYSLSMLARTAALVSQKCEESGNAKTWLSDREILMGKRGICDHAAISRVYKRSTHTDCGPNFVRDLFIDLVRAAPLLVQNPTPTGGFSIMNDAVDFLICPVDGGLQKLQSDGGIFNDQCNHYHGSYLEDNMAPHRNVPRTFRAIQRYGNTGYSILANDGTSWWFGS